MGLRRRLLVETRRRAERMTLAPHIIAQDGWDCANVRCCNTCMTR